MRKVLLLHTGGTLGMQGSPMKPGGFLESLTENVPALPQIAEVETRVVYNLDSSDVGPSHWSTLAQVISESRRDYDGFVIVHGTDTMAYTASALSFALEGLDRPVILTGAQRPLTALRSDAPRNLIDAVELATYDIPEVAICLDGVLLRGCRSTKSHNRDYRAFDSPGTAPLAKLGVDVDLAPHIRRPDRRFSCTPAFDDKVIVIFVTPGLQPALMEHLLDAPTPPRGIVLSAFGVGTAPTHFLPLAPVVKKAVDNGIDVVAITQSSGRIDLSLYQTGVSLLEAGAIPGGCMLAEAATTKLMHALARFENRHQRAAYLQSNVAGEMD